MESIFCLLISRASAVFTPYSTVVEAAARSVTNPGLLNRASFTISVRGHFDQPPGNVNCSLRNNCYLGRVILEIHVLIYENGMYIAKLILLAFHAMKILLTYPHLDILSSSVRRSQGLESLLSSFIVLCSISMGRMPYSSRLSRKRID